MTGPGRLAIQPVLTAGPHEIAASQPNFGVWRETNPLRWEVCDRHQQLVILVCTLQSMGVAECSREILEYLDGTASSDVESGNNLPLSYVLLDRKAVLGELTMILIGFARVVGHCTYARVVHRCRAHLWTTFPNPPTYPVCVWMHVLHVCTSRCAPGTVLGQ